MLQFLRKVFVNGGTKYFKGEPIFSEIFGPRQTNFVEVFSPGGPLVGGPIFWWQLCSTTAPSLVLWPGRRLSPALFIVWSEFDLPRVRVAMSCGGGIRRILSCSQAERGEKTLLPTVSPCTDGCYSFKVKLSLIVNAARCSYYRKNLHHRLILACLTLWYLLYIPSAAWYCVSCLYS